MMRILVLIQLVVLFFMFHDVHGFNTTADSRKLYIVYMGSHSFPDSESLISANHELLSSVTGGRIEEAHQSVIYHYHKSFRGFAALLSPKHAKKISKKDCVVSVLENQIGHLHTTRSWDFMGAPSNGEYFHEAKKFDYDVIVGHFDGGIWPESPSFSENGIGPVPGRWRGSCDDNDYPCTRKVIGHKWYANGFEQEYGPISSYTDRYYYSTRDDFGHGTHTASTAVGSFIKDVNIQNMGRGDVRGGAPGARLAVYKVCWNNMCSCADIMKGYDDAIHDGVDIITMSLGAKVINNQPNFLKDCFSIGSLHAFQNGILVSSSAANSGDPESVANAAPWVLTVGATSGDRDLVTPIQLGNSLTLRGHGFNPQGENGYYQVIYARSAALSWASPDSASACEENTLDNQLIWGKIVVCTTVSSFDEKYLKRNVVYNAGGVGVIIIDPFGNDMTTSDQGIPTAMINLDDANKLQTYLKTSENPAVLIQPYETQFNIKPSPRMAVFSSRGPGSAPDIIKPDISAPGMNILASFPNYQNPSMYSFGLNSGTSMACPHVSGVAAMLKGHHHDWSPAAVKSAIMTSASYLDNTGGPIRSGEGYATPFDMGSGNLDPTRALNPGLVYDYNTDDLIAYLCGIDNINHIENILRKQVQCPQNTVPTYNLNYPSISVSNLRSDSVVVKRTVTYVGQDNDRSTFHVNIENPAGISLEVEPNVLDFSNGQSTATFTVNVRVKEPKGSYTFGSITWFNNVHSVRSAVAIRAY